MIPFADMPKRLKGIGKSREWLAQTAGYTKPTIDHAFSARSPHKTERMRARLSNAIEQEEIAQQKMDIEKQGLFAIEFTPAQFAEVDAASRIVQSPSLKDYCMDAVMIRTHEIMTASGQDHEITSIDNPRPVLSAVAEPPSRYTTRKKSH